MSIMPFISCPATGDIFIGRQGLIKNLRGRVSAGESVAVIGGPKLGKTSLVRTALEGISDHRVIELDLNIPLAARLDASSGAILLLENLDSLSDEAIESLLAGISKVAAASVVITGGRRLRTLLDHSGTLAGLRFRLYPLSVLLDGEMRQMIGRDTTASLATWTGNHPYLIKLFLHYGDKALSAGRYRWEPFIHKLAAEIGDGPERQLLCYLIKCGKPVNPAVAGSAMGIRDIKAIADTLVYLGAITRCIRHDEATLFAGCRLLNAFIIGCRRSSYGPGGGLGADDKPVIEDA
jgi:hypothetical protein